ncbi:response regulator [bacterium]|nr:response regulator [bacterium]
MDARKRILVADDNPAMAKVIAFNLSAAGFETTVASNGQIAWELLQAEPFDFLVTDYQMPEMDGRELVRHIRSSLRWRHIPVIMLTAKELELDTSIASDELQLASVLQKPFSPSELIGRIHSYFHRVCSV